MRGETISTLRPVFFSTFQSTPLMRGETFIRRHHPQTEIISIHSPHARGDGSSVVCRWSGCISIHSPHARGDGRTQTQRPRGRISIHSPHARGDAYLPLICAAMHNFNPLPSCEGRPLPRARKTACIYFNPLPSCEGRLTPRRGKLRAIHISIHSPHARGDNSPPTRMRGSPSFQSTPLMRGETPLTVYIIPH